MFDWQIVCVLAFVVYAYADAAGREDGDAVVCGIGF